MTVSQTYFQKGFGLKSTVKPVLSASYASGVVDRLKELDYAARAGDLELRLAREFGFCYGVDRAVEYAYETRQQFPDRRVFLSGEIIHNPDVNARIQAMDIRILPEDKDPVARYAEVAAGDVVILPAFGVTVAEMTHLRETGCVLVDTTCGSVLNVWKNVHKYAREGFTAVIHGKHYHEETKATASQALTHEGGHYLCVRDKDEAELVCAFIRGQVGAERDPRAVRARGQPRLRSRARPPQARPRQPDDDADEREPGDPGDAARRHARPPRRSGPRSSASAPSTPSAPPPRTARTRCCACWPTSRSTSWWSSGASTAATPRRWRASARPGCRPTTSTGPTASRARASAIARWGSTRTRPPRPGCPRARFGSVLTAGASTPNNVVGEVVRRILALRGLTPADLQAA